MKYIIVGVIIVLIAVAGLYGSTNLGLETKWWDLGFYPKVALGGLAIGGYLLVHFRTRSKFRK